MESRPLDKKAVRIVRSARRSHGDDLEPVLRTSELLFSWAQVRSIGEADLVRIVRAVAGRASFFRPRRPGRREAAVELHAGVVAAPRASIYVRDSF